MSEQIIATHEIDGRSYHITRTTWTNSPGLSYDVADAGTGLCLTPTSLDEAPTCDEVAEIVTALRADLEAGTLDCFFADQEDVVREALPAAGG